MSPSTARACASIALERDRLQGPLELTGAPGSRPAGSEAERRASRLSSWRIRERSLQCRTAPSSAVRTIPIKTESRITRLRAPPTSQPRNRTTTTPLFWTAKMAIAAPSNATSRYTTTMTASRPRPHESRAHRTRGLTSPQRLSESLLALAVRAQRSEEPLDDVFLAGASRGRLVRSLEELPERHHGLGHRPVPPGRAQVAEGRARHVARALHVPDVAHRDVEVGAHHAGDHRPLHALGLQAEVGELGNLVHRRHRAQV